MTEYNVYIDESGDEGIKKGSKYFILTAILVEKEKDLEVSRTIDKIKQKLEVNIKSQLHWNRIKGIPNKIMILEKICNEDIKIINIVINTYEIEYLSPVEMYNYFSGYLYERICWFVRDNNAVANINISSRGNLNKERLINFLSFNKKFNIDYSKIKSLKIYPNSKKKLLQLADSCCSSLFQILKYNNLKIYYRYLDYLTPKFYTYKGKNIGYGLKYVPTNKEYSNEFNNLITYIEQKK